MSPYGFLALSTVMLVVICIVITLGLIAVGAYFFFKTYCAHRYYNLVDRELDRNPNARLNEIYEAPRYVDGDLPGVQPVDTKGDNGRLTLSVDDNGFPSSEPPRKSLPSLDELDN